MNKKQLLENKLRKIIREERMLLESVDRPLFCIYKEKTGDFYNDQPIPVFTLKLEKPNMMTLKWIEDIPNKLSMKIEKELEDAVIHIFDKYKNAK